MRQESLILGFDLLPRIQTGGVSATAELRLGARVGINIR